MNTQIISGAGGSSATRAGDAQRAAPSAAMPVVRAEYVPGAGAPSPAVDADRVKEAAHQINEHLNALRQGLEFSVDDETGTTVVRVVDAETGETIRQIPSEEVLAISRSLERLQGVLLKLEA